MRRLLITVCLVLSAAAPANAVDFLGVELCVGSVDTSVVLPVGSPLSLESAEIGRHGGLLMLLKADKGRVMNHVDELMEFYTGVAGTGSEEKLQWSGNQITAYAQLITKGHAALAVSTTDDCRAAEPTGAAATAGVAMGEKTTETVPEPDGESPANEVEAPVVAGTAVAAATSGPVSPETTTDAVTPEFALKGPLKHSASEADWVDVMGVVVNSSGIGYAVASFDLSVYDAAGDLICVDTISVNQLRNGQERAFRASIRCADYDDAVVDSWKLQFAGGH